MESLPITAKAIAFTEKKMDMTLEDIIKMSKKKNSGGKKPPRQPIKKRPFHNGNSDQGNAKVQRFMESRSSIRQGVLAQRRSNLGGNQFPATKQAAKKAAAMPMHNNRAVRWNKPSASTLVQKRPVGDAFQNSKSKEAQNQAPRTMDALFAQMKAQRMRNMPSQQQAKSAPDRQFNQQRRVQRQQPRRSDCKHDCNHHLVQPLLVRRRIHANVHSLCTISIFFFCIAHNNIIHDTTTNQSCPTNPKKITHRTTTT